MDIESVDIMATLINLKHEYEDITRNGLRLTFSGAAEAHSLAEEIARAGISVILTSPRPYLGVWEQRKMQVKFFFFQPGLPLFALVDRLPCPPLSKYSSVSTLLAKGVNVAIGLTDEATAQNT